MTPTTLTRTGERPVSAPSSTAPHRRNRRPVTCSTHRRVALAPRHGLHGVEYSTCSGCGSTVAHDPGANLAHLAPAPCCGRPVSAHPSEIVR